MNEKWERENFSQFLNFESANLFVHFYDPENRIIHLQRKKWTFHQQLVSRVFFPKIISKQKVAYNTSRLNYCSLTPGSLSFEQIENMYLYQLPLQWTCHAKRAKNKNRDNLSAKKSERRRERVGAPRRWLLLLHFFFPVFFLFLLREIIDRISSHFFGVLRVRRWYPEALNHSEKKSARLYFSTPILHLELYLSSSHHTQTSSSLAFFFSHLCYYLFLNLALFITQIKCW